MAEFLPMLKIFTKAAPDKHSGKKGKYKNQDKNRWRYVAAYGLPLLLAPVGFTLTAQTVRGVWLAIFAWVAFSVYLTILLEWHIWKDKQRDQRKRVRIACGCICACLVVLGFVWQARIKPADRPPAPPSLGEKSTEMVRIAMLPKIVGAADGFILEPNKPVSVTVVIANTGQTVASNCETELDIVRIFGEKLPANWRDNAKEANSQPSVSPLGPGGKLTIPLATVDKISPTEFRQIMEGKSQVRVVAWGRYDDEFGGRGTRFILCWVYDWKGKRKGSQISLISCSQEQLNEFGTFPF